MGDKRREGPDGSALVEAARALEEDGRFGDAAALYSEILARDSRNISIYVKAASLQAYKMHATSEAIALLQRALEVRGLPDESYLEAKYLLAQLLSESGSEPSAYHLYEEIYFVDVFFRDVAARMVERERR